MNAGDIVHTRDGSTFRIGRGAELWRASRRNDAAGNWTPYLVHAELDRLERRLVQLHGPIVATEDELPLE